VEDLSRKVDFFDQGSIADDAVDAFGCGLLEEGPWHEGGENQDGIGNVAAVNTDKALHQGEDQHQHDWFENGPGDPHISLLITHRDVFPGERHGQFAVLHEVSYNPYHDFTLSIYR